MKLKALFNAVILKPVEVEDNTHSNIIIPDTGTDTNKTGKVVDVGEGHYTITGTWIKTTVNVGDIVIVPTMGFTKFEFKGEEYWIGPENQLLGIINLEENQNND